MTIRYRTPGLGEARQDIEEYTSSLESDTSIAGIVVEVMLAHVTHLYERRVIDCQVASRIVQALLELRGTEWMPRKGYEDVFEALEAVLAERIGDAAGYIGVGRSRNDHVAAALRLYARQGLVEILRELLETRRVLINRAEEYLDSPLPGFTHGQVSQAITIGHLLLSYEEALADNWLLAWSTLGVVDRSPLGSSAGAGTTIALDRYRLAKLLGFQGIVYNTYYAVGDRSFLSAVVNTLALLMVTVSRVASDLIKLAELGVIDLPRHHLATSSVMPHKRNPVTLEVIRARAGQVIGYAVTALAVQKGLEYSYNLDLQEANTSLYSAVVVSQSSLRVLRDLLASMTLNTGRARELLEGKVYWGAEAAEQIAVKKGVAFRQAHGLLAERLARDNWVVGRETESLLASIGFPTQPEKVLSLYATTGSANPRLLVDHVEHSLDRLRSDEEKLHSLMERIESSREELLKTAMEVANCGG